MEQRKHCFAPLFLCVLLLMITLCCHAVVVDIPSGPGLPDKSINVICKDKHELMWLGTQSGLCTYDGYEFRQLFTSSIINREAIQQMAYQQDADLLWVGTDKGLFNVNCHSFEIKEVLNGMPGGSAVSGIFQTADHSIYIVYKTGGLFKVLPTGTCKLLAKIPVVDPQQYPTSMRMDDADIVISMASSPISYRYHLTNNKLLGQSIETVSCPGLEISNTRISFLNALRSVSYTIDSSKLATSFLWQIKQLDNIAFVHYAANDHVFLACRPCYIYELDMRTYTFNKVISTLFTGRLIKSFYADANHVIWIGTNKGLIKIMPEQHLFQKELMLEPAVSVRSIYADESGNRYAGTYSGLYFSKYGGNGWSKISDNIPFAFAADKGSYLYFIEEHFKLFRINKYTLQLETGFYKVAPNFDISKKTGFALTTDERGKVWIGLSSGVATYDPATGLLAPYKIKGWANENTEVRYIRITTNNKLLLCTNNGFYEIDRGTQKTQHWNTTTRPALSSNTTNFVQQDMEGNSWICTEGGGINILNKTGEVISVLNTQSGLSSNTTYDILFRNKRAWISTYNGLSSFDMEHKVFCNFYTNTGGISDNEFNRNAFLADDAAHRFYFGTINGLNSFDPDKIPIQSNGVKLFASAISKWDNNQKAYVNFPTISDRHTLTLDPADHSLMIHLALSDYSNSDKVIFSYRVKGLMDDWIYLTGQHTVQLNGLAPGIYDVEIRAIDDHGMPAINELHYHIKVIQPFFKTIWFYLILLVVISGVISYFFFLKIKNIKQINHLRQQISSDLHDEVGSMLTRITMNSDYLKYSKHSDEERFTKLTRISSLSRYASSSMNDILWTIDSRNNFTGSLADRIREHAEEMLGPLSIEIEFDIKVASKEIIAAEERQEIYRIFKEAINNIVKHSKATEVHIRFYYNKADMLMEVENNGIVVHESTSSKGQGLRNISMRAQKINATAHIIQEDEWFKVRVEKHF